MPSARAKPRGRSPWFTPALFRFLEELALHNDRDWFERNRERYVRDVRDPMLRFVADAAPVLRQLAPRLVAVRRGVAPARPRPEVHGGGDAAPVVTHPTWG